MDLKSTLPLVEKVLSWLSLKRVATLGITAVVIITSITLFENRTQLVDGVKHRNSSERSVSDEPFKISPASDELIKTFVRKNSEVTMVSIVSVNMRVLQRHPVYFYTLDPAVKQMVDSYAQSKNLTQPFFNQDEKNDNQMVSLMNGEFQCVKFDETVNATIFPGIKNKVKFICRVGLSPYHGQFSGYISALLSDVPTSYKQQELRLEMVQLATSIYMADVVGKRNRQ